jgi:hypothetical protein
VSPAFKLLMWALGIGLGALLIFNVAVCYVLITWIDG